MSSIMESTYKKIKAAKDKNPDQPVTAIAEKLGLDASYYYNWRARLGHGKAKRKDAPKAAAKRYKKIALEAPKGDGQLILVMGSPEQLKEFVGGVL